MSWVSGLFGSGTAQQNKAAVNKNYGTITLINSLGGAAVPIEFCVPWSPVALIENPSPSQLLTWHGRLTPLIGREQELTALQRWVDSSANLSVWILAGEGGIGKTRLAAELAESLVEKKWSAGFVDLARFNDAASLTLDKRTLLLVDYPEERPDQLARLFDLLKRHTGPHKLRVALLTRSAPDVKKRLAERSATHLEYNEPWSFAADSVQRYALFRAAFAALRSDGPAKLPEESAFNAWLARSRLHASALFIVAAALIARRQGAGQLELVGYDVLAQIARDEMAKIKRAAGRDALAANAALDAVALATAFDGVTLAVLRGLTSASDLGFAAISLRQTLLITQHAAEPTTSACNLPRLEPDLYAAAFLNEWRLTRWNSDTNNRFNSAFAELWAIAPVDKMLPHWNRVAYDMTIRLGIAVNWLDDWLCDAAQKSVVPVSTFRMSLADASWFGLPHAPSQIGKLLIAATTGHHESALTERGRLLHLKSMHLAAAGDRAGALEAARAAVTMFRWLAKDNAVAFEPYLASCLNSLSIRFSKTGDRVGGLDAAREAVSMYRRLAQENPAEYESDWANSMSNLANRLSHTGHLDDARDAAREATTIHRRLAQANPTLYELDFAGSVNNFSNFLGEAGNHAEALDAAGEAVSIYRRLASANPASCEAGLATSIHTLANRLSDKGDRAAALNAAREAVTIYRRLAQANPSAHAPELAKSLCVLAQLLSLDSQKEAAANVATEAAERLRPWAVQFPDAYGELLAHAEALLAAYAGS